MSHIATNWAFQQRSLSPSAFRILAVLADCHNPSYGCFPKQSFIADNAEMGRSTVNRQLLELEDLNLVERRQIVDKETGKQRPTRYVFAFEEDFKPKKTVSQNGTRNMAKAESQIDVKPCPISAPIRVPNRDSNNHVKEPVIEPVTERARANAGEKELEREQNTLISTLSNKDLENRVQRFCSGSGFKSGTWKDWDTATFDYHKRNFGSLTEVEALEAEKWRDAYLFDISDRKKKPVSPGNFTRDKLWQKLDPAILKRFEALKQVGVGSNRSEAEGHGKPFGPAWMAWRMTLMLRGQEVAEVHGVPLVCGSSPIRSIKQKAWPRLTGFDDTAARSRAIKLPERCHEAKDAMEWVASDGEVYQAWHKHYEACGWPHLPSHDSLNGAWFPKGGPNCLDAFQAFMNNNQRNGASDADEN